MLVKVVLLKEVPLKDTSRMGSAVPDSPNMMA